MFYYIQLEKRNRTFIYEYDDDIDIGTFCKVDFNGSIKQGVITDKIDKVNVEYNIKKIIEIQDKKLDTNLMLLIKWIHDYYLEPYGSLIPLIQKPKGKCIKKERIEKITEIDYSLNDEQKDVYTNIINSDKKVHLIHGVTGSGKTYVYINLIQQALSEDKSVIFLVPEIALTTQFAKKLKERFGLKIAIWHSKLSADEKTTYYENIEKGLIKIVLGTRSCIFTAVKNLGYIIIDEEHEQTYKQQESPRYHLKNVAIKRAMIEDAKVILGSATPSFETYYQAQNSDIVLHELKNRYNNAMLPQFDIIDLNEQEEILNDNVINEIQSTLDKDEQVIILYNRKAYSHIIKCLDCNYVAECLDCSYKLIYSKTQNRLKCNQCERQYSIITKCKCGSEKIIKIGLGTESIEEKLKNVFDENIILRMDSDTMNTKTKIEKAYNSFLSGKYKILVGTQILAKGFHFPDVTLVVILNADQMLNLLNYRVQEKTFQIITQASGRAGRGNKKGRVILQTFNKDSELIHSIITNDYNMIYNNQIQYRQLLFLPPISKQINILITSLKEQKAENLAKKIYTKIEQEISKYAVVNIPINASIYKISNRYRKVINIIYDRKYEKKVKNGIKKHIFELNEGSDRVLVDVDPIEMF